MAERGDQASAIRWSVFSDSNTISPVFFIPLLGIYADQIQIVRPIWVNLIIFSIQS